MIELSEALLELAESLEQGERREVVDTLILSLGMLMVKRFRKQARYIAKQVARAKLTLPTPAAIAAAVSLDQFEMPSFQRSLLKLLQAAYDGGASIASHDLDLAGIPDSLPGPGRAVSEFEREIDATTEARVSSVILDGLKNGESVSQIRKDIFGEFAKWIQRAEAARAQMIAANEVAGAFNRGMLDTAKASGKTLLKEWWVDSDPCPICLGNVGEAIPLEAEFNSGDTEPPAHPWCRCSLRLVDSDG